MYKKRGYKARSKKKKLLADPRGNAVSNFFNSIFLVRQVVLLFSGINVQWPKSGLRKKRTVTLFK